MGALKGVLSGFFLLVSSAAGAWSRNADGEGESTGHSSALRLERWSPYVADASARFRIPQTWIWRVMRAESGGRTTLGGRPITSRAGAMGLMQLMPGTWAAMRARHGLGPDPYDPRDNVLAGAAYLRTMYDRFGYPGLFAAYNAGPARYAEHLAGGRPLPAETVAFLAATASTPSSPAGGIRAERGGAAIFVRLPGSSPTGTPSSSTGRDALFVRLRTARAGAD